MADELQRPLDRLTRLDAGVPRDERIAPPDGRRNSIALAPGAEGDHSIGEAGRFYSQPRSVASSTACARSTAPSLP